MELAVVNSQALLQMYHCRDYPWHTVAATSPISVPAAAAVAAAAENKEKIIANADFTTTSAIARRRLSSKKRRNTVVATTESSGVSGETSGRVTTLSSSSEGSATTNSPTMSVDTTVIRHCHQQSPSPLVTTTSSLTHHISPPISSVGVGQRSLPATTRLATHPPPAHMETHQVVPSHPQATLPTTAAVPLVPAAYHFAPSLPIVTAADHKAFAHPVYSQLQQELNYRYLQDHQSGPSSVHPGNRGTAAFSAPHSQPSSSGFYQQGSVGMATSSESYRSHKVKWCSAHVTIAQQILAHQQQAKTVLELARSSALAAEAAAATSKPLTSVPPPTSLDPTHQITLLQMYGVPTTAIAGGGYMAVPGGVSYPALPPDVQLHNLSFVQNTAPTALFMDTNILSLKPVGGVSAQQGAEAGGRGVQMVNGVQILPYTTAGQHQPLPVAAVVPGVGVGSGVSGSYVGHVPIPVLGNCVLNPCQPGVMAAPWVR